MDEYLQSSLLEEETIQNRWAIIKTAVIMDAGETIGEEERIRKRHWFDLECQTSVEEKKKAYLKMI